MGLGKLQGNVMYSYRDKHFVRVLKALVNKHHSLHLLLLLIRADPTQGGKRCLDVDECRQRPAPCDHDCTNTFGSYTCSCSSGYRLHERSIAHSGIGGSSRQHHSMTSRCMDVDECISKGKQMYN